MNRPGTWKYAAAAAAAVVGMLLIVNAPALTSRSLLEGRMLSVHLVLELFAIVIAALIVTVSWHTFDRRADHAARALVAGFTVVAICDLLHALTYQGMPAFLTESSTPRAIFFWLMGRSFEVLALGLIALNAVPALSRNLSLALGGATALAVGAFGSYAIDAFPATFVDGVGVTPFKARYEYTLAVLNLLVTVLLWRRAQRDDSRQLRLLALSSFLMGVGGFAFTSYVAPSDFQNIAGHLYKVVAYTLLYQATFLASIRAPYDALRASESQLRESRTRLETLSANLPQSVLYQVVRGHDGTMRFTEVSTAIERINGLRPSQVLRDPMAWYDQIHPEDLPALVAAEQRSAETMLVFDCEARLRRADGSQRRMHFVSAPRRLDDGRIAWDGVQTDVTERAEARDIRRGLELQLREAQKMELLGTFASGIAHDFNNVLGSILGNAAMARDDVRRGATAEALHGIEQVHKAGDRARALVRQILTFSRRERAERQPQPLQPVVAESLALLRATLPANVEVQLQAAAPHALALVDRTQIEQIVLNLCSNAWQAMGERGGRIVVQIDETLLDGEAALCLGLVPGHHVRLRVEDNGSGMDAATRQRIFEPFFTTKPRGRGTGLGLSVVHGIVQEHEGAITVQSSPGQGTRFEIHLPALAAAAAGDAAAATTSGAVAVDGGGLRVLYLDDDEIMALMVDRLLQRAGFAVTCLQEPQAAIDALCAVPPAFDLLVTDYNMPLLSGLDVLRAARQVRPGLPAVLTSGSVNDTLRAQALALDVAEVLEKQHTLEALAPAIERTWARVARMQVAAAAG
ncbi:MASE3 domain-containing protein [Rubrivivax sp. RP6-9]|uniref:MASE3 domain-containing protein n=1 Tax=Rubrivivax sp. RP6-9 TaxID=3415750 RepID=UPI003CC61E4B